MDDMLYVAAYLDGLYIIRHDKPTPVFNENEEIKICTQAALVQNYPNPFNPTTVISFAIPKAGDVKLLVYNAIGEVVAEMVNGYKEAGRFTVTLDASHLTSGIYFYSFEAGIFIQSNKMILLK